MLVTITITRYKTIFIPFAFLAMAFFRLPLWMNKKIVFFKLMGSGKNGTFDKVPDLRQWAILTVSDSAYDELKRESEQGYLRQTLGSFICGWLKLFKCETYNLLLEPLESHGSWDGKKLFEGMLGRNDHEGMIAVLTRATIRLSKLKYFWANVAPVANKMKTAQGFLFSSGVGEVPWIKQATFSVWKNKEDMKAFAYGMREHTEVIKKTRKQDWYSEEMFTRFKILETFGTIKGENPLKVF